MEGKKYRVGWLIGKDNDLVEDPRYVGDKTFVKDVPNVYRVHTKTNEYLLENEDAKLGKVHVDVAIPWWIQKNHSDIEIDLILPEDISLERLQSNDVNFIIGYDLINAVFEGEERTDLVRNALKDCGNIWPTFEVQEFIYMKSQYMNRCKQLKIPMAPTIFCRAEDRSPQKLLEEMQARGWKTFVMKLSYSAFSLGFMKKTVEQCKKDPRILEQYFEDNADSPEYVVQEYVSGFKENWETRGFWWNGEFVYAIANKAACINGKEVIIPEPPAEYLEAVKRIGKQALACLPKMYNKHGAEIGNILIRTDLGCSTGTMHDKDLDWKAGGKTFFLNEIEYGGTNYFTRHVEFDNIPIWGARYAAKVREIMTKKPGDAPEPLMPMPVKADAKILKKRAALNKNKPKNGAKKVKTVKKAGKKSPVKKKAVAKKRAVAKKASKKVVKKPSKKTAAAKKKPAARKTNENGKKAVRKARK